MSSKKSLGGNTRANGKVGGLVVSARRGAHAKAAVCRIKTVSRPAEAYQKRKEEEEEKGVVLAKKRLARALSVANRSGKSSKSARREGTAAAERRVAAAVFDDLLSAVDLVEGVTSFSPEKKKKKKKTTQAVSSTLATFRRGEKPAVAVRASYNSTQQVYDFDGELGATYSICRLGEQIKSGALTVSSFKKKNLDGNPQHGVPHTSMRRWVADDKMVRNRQGQKGKIIQ
jgi:ribosomal protein L21E